jgi:hypothetical protein
MKLRAGLIIGFAGGYVLGARAGRERFEQIKRWWGSLTSSPQVQQLADRSKEIAEEAGRKSVGAVQHGVSKLGTNVKDRLGNGKSEHHDITAQEIGI